MNVFAAVAFIVIVTAGAITAMLLVRRRAPEGGYFNDGDRASGVFGVLATGFSVLLGFLIFLAFDSYDASRSGAEVEAVTVGQQLQTAQLMSEDVRPELTGQLVCYARYVVHEEWDQMIAGSKEETLNPWGVAMFQTVEKAEPSSSTEETAYGKWLDETSTRQEARQQRVHGADGVIPTPLWVALFLISVVIMVYLLCFADSAERAFIQGLLMGSVVLAISVMLMVLAFLNDPYTTSVGSVKPRAMERTILLMEKALEATDVTTDPPCDANGLPT